MSSETEEIKSRIDIVDFIQKYVSLKKSGINYAGLCPFHNEKTPSFMVNPERQIFKCFGCNEGGDIFDFVMKIEGLEFVEALKLLAEQTGVELKPFGGSRDTPWHVSADRISKTRLYALNEFLASAWQQILLKHPSAQKARDYLSSRQISLPTIREWQIGLAPPENISRKLLAQKKFTDSEQRLASQPVRLAGRIVFPIRDLVGKIVGFTGRIIEENQTGPKYWNTPETAIFFKGKTLYGLDRAKKAIRDHDLALLVEGQTDVILLHQAGYKMAVATSGTALTADHLKILKRFTPNLAIAFDQDAAGQKAAKRAIELMFSEDIIPSIIMTAEGKDPADAVSTNLAAWEESFQNRRSYLAWLIDYEISKYGKDDGAAKKRVSTEVLPWIAKITNSVERSHWILQLASQLKISEKSIEEDIAKIVQPKEKPNLTKVSDTDQIHYEKEILFLGLLVRFPLLIKDIQADDIFQTLIHYLPNESFRQTLEKLSSWNSKEHFDRFIDHQEQSVNKYLNLSYLVTTKKYPILSAEEAKEELKMILNRMIADQKEKIKARFAEEIGLAEKSGDRQKVKQLLADLQNAILR